MRHKILTMALCAVTIMTGCQETTDVWDGTTLPEVTTLPVQTVTSSTAVLRGSTSGAVNGMVCRGVCFSDKEVFSFKDSPCISAEAGEGEFSSRTYELVPMHSYNMKAFAVMKDGTVVYGDEMTFSTSDFTLPTVTVSPATDIYPTELTLHGTLVEAGDYAVMSRGFVYTKDTGTVLEIDSTGVSKIYSQDATDEFSATIGELEIGGTYRVRAFALTQQGAGYSDEISVTTLNIHPVQFDTLTILENTYSSLKIQTAVKDSMGATITKVGFCWSETIKLPTVKSADYAESGEGFTKTFEDVKPGKVYYVRPYAETAETGVNYGSVTRIRVKTYDCDGGMVKVTPKNPVYLGWLGNYNEPDMPAKYKMAHDSVFFENMSVGKNATPTPSEATVQPFCIARYEVTNKWFCEFLNAYGSATIKDGSYQGKDILFDAYTDIRKEGGKWMVDSAYIDCPVVGVTYYGAETFCTFFGGYLPTEAQWEVAARGNVYSDDPAVPMYTFSGSDNLDDVAVYAKGINRYRCEPVGTKKPNQLGLYDMSGNAQEMTSSWYGYYTAVYKEYSSNNNMQKVIRGGRAQRGKPEYFQCNTRETYDITKSISYSNFIGFRFACNPTDED